jgi:hypothetical protein
MDAAALAANTQLTNIENEKLDDHLNIGVAVQ